MSDDDFDRKLGERIRETRDDADGSSDASDADDTDDSGDSAGSGDAYDTGGTNDTGDSSGTGDAGDAGVTGGSGTTDSADVETESSPSKDAAPVRERPQTVLYLPAELREALADRYNRLDGMDKMNGGDGIAKHDEFYAGVVQAALDHPDLEEFVGVTTEEEVD